MEKLPGLDKMVTLTDTSPVTPQVEQKKMPIEEMLPDSEKKKTKKKKKSKGGEAAGASASMPKKTGPKVTALQEALDELLQKEQLDEQLNSWMSSLGCYPSLHHWVFRHQQFLCRKLHQRRESEWKR